MSVQKLLLAICTVATATMTIAAVDMVEINTTEGEYFSVNQQCATHCDWEIIGQETAMIQLDEVCTVTKPHLIGGRTIVYRFRALKPGKTLLIFEAVNRVSSHRYAKAMYLITITPVEERVQNNIQQMIPYGVLGTLSALGALNLVAKVFERRNNGESILQNAFYLLYIATLGTTSYYTTRKIMKLRTKNEHLRKQALAAKESMNHAPYAPEPTQIANLDELSLPTSPEPFSSEVEPIRRSTRGEDDLALERRPFKKDF